MTMIVGNDHSGQELSSDSREKDMHENHSVPVLKTIIPKRK